MALLRAFVRANTLFNSIKISRICRFTYSTKSIQEEDKPIPYLKSQAAAWPAKLTRTGNQERLWYEPYVILTSISIFLIYFCILREENDVDEDLKMSLYSRIHGLEEHQLRIVLKYNEERGLDTKDIIKRLQEIEAEKTKEGE